MNSSLSDLSKLIQKNKFSNFIENEVHNKENLYDLRDPTQV